MKNQEIHLEYTFGSKIKCGPSQPWDQIIYHCIYDCCLRLLYRRSRIYVFMAKYTTKKLTAEGENI